MPAFTSIAIAAGLGLAAAGTAVSVQSAHQQAAFQQQEIQGEQQAEAQRRQAMELEANRKQTEMVRQQQRARSLALSSATNQGANFGSGLQGGYGQISGQYNTQSLANSQNLDIGRNIYDINGQISQAKIGMANAQAYGAFGAGLSSLGGALVTSAGAFGKIGSSTSAAFGRAMSFGTGPGSYGMGGSFK